MRAGWIGLLLLAAACNGEQDPAVADSSAPAPVDADGDSYTDDVDCDDADAGVHPDAEETWYDGVDQDCDGADDFDQDADGVRRGVDDGSDCDDTNPLVRPGQDERCDQLDNNCDGVVDDDPVDGVLLYVDLDGDGFGDGDPQGPSCEIPAGVALVDGDCDDLDATVNPDAVEVCDGVDQDCSGFADDDAVDALDWYADYDADGYGDAEGLARACSQPEQYVADASDCDASDPLSFPGAPELCDRKDNDCDATADEEAVDFRTYYADLDVDGYGRVSDTVLACGAPSGYVESPEDCDDGDGAVNPAAEELCDGVDNDCDGTLDSDATDAIAYHPDTDGDGYGDSDTVTTSCAAVAGWIVDGTDCDDTDRAARPGGTEVCGGGDEDCDGAVDEPDATGTSSWYIDADGDGYGEPRATTEACARPSGYASVSTDCDDTLASANPGARESCDSVDNDCDGTTDESDAYDAPTWYLDADGDTYGGASRTSVACAAPSGYVANDEDCDDDIVDVSPAAAESRDLVDEDCDGLTDEDFVAVGDIVITEIARQPYTGGSGAATNPNAQWFEVYNSSAYDVDLAGWYVEEEVGDSFTISPATSVIVPAGGYAVLCYDDAYFGTPSACDYTWGDTSWGTGFYDNTFYFDRDDDLIAVYLEGTLMDEVEWALGSDADGDSWPRTARYSMRLDNDALDPASNDDAGAWCLSTKSIYSSSSYTGYPDYGTPGSTNGSCD